jgi:hypothetical protein
MNYPYSSFLLEVRKAKLQLACVFQARPGQCPQNPPSPNYEDIPTRSDQQPAAGRPSLSREVVCALGGLWELRRNAKSPGGLYWMREDMGAHSFAWTLLLLGTVAAAQTDQPMLWLLVGPAPFVVGYAAVAFLRRRFNLCAYLRGLRHQDGGSGQCQCQCQ